MSSTCSMRARRSPSPSASATSCACARSRARSRRRISRAARRSGFPHAAKRTVPRLCKRGLSALEERARMKRHDFLVEIGTEELPPKSLLALAEAFRDGVAAGLDAARTLARRRARLLHAAPARRARAQAPRSPARAADRAARPAGFRRFRCRRQADPRGDGIRRILRRRRSTTSRAINEPKANSSSARTTRPGVAPPNSCPASCRRRSTSCRSRGACAGARATAEFVRPVHWVVMLHGDEIVPGEILGLAAGRMTRGHRFHAPKPIALRSPGGYLAALERRGHVLADFEARRERIRAGSSPRPRPRAASPSSTRPCSTR